jgi:glutathione S-transferase
MPGGYRALEVIERALADAPFLVGGRYTIADIALYAYTHVADEGGFDLVRFPAIRGWLSRVAAQPGYVPMVEPGSGARISTGSSAGSTG